MVVSVRGISVGHKHSRSVERKTGGVPRKPHRPQSARRRL
jgi:hypothetical protein